MVRDPGLRTEQAVIKIEVKEGLDRGGILRVYPSQPTKTNFLQVLYVDQSLHVSTRFLSAGATAPGGSQARGLQGLQKQRWG